MWLMMGGACLLIGAMLFVSGIYLATAESGQRWMAGIFGLLLGVLGWMIMAYLAAPRAPLAAWNAILWGSIVIGGLAAAALGWKRMHG